MLGHHDFQAGCVVWRGQAGMAHGLRRFLLNVCRVGTSKCFRNVPGLVLRESTTWTFPLDYLMDWFITAFCSVPRCTVCQIMSGCTLIIYCSGRLYWTPLRYLWSTMESCCRHSYLCLWVHDNFYRWQVWPSVISKILILIYNIQVLSIDVVARTCNRIGCQLAVSLDYW